MMKLILLVACALLTVGAEKTPEQMNREYELMKDIIGSDGHDSERKEHGKVGSRVRVIDPGHQHADKDHKPKDKEKVLKYKGRHGKVVSMTNDADGMKIMKVQLEDEKGEITDETVDFHVSDLEHALNLHDESSHGDDYTEFFVGAYVRENEGKKRVGRIAKLYDEDSGLHFDVEFDGGNVEKRDSKEMHGKVEFFPGARVGMADGKPKFGEVVSMFDAKGTEELMLEVKFDDGTVLKLNSKLLYPAERTHTGDLNVEEAKKLATKDAHAEFGEADKDGDGHLSHEELKAHHEEDSDDQMKRIIADLDKDEDGKVSRDEFTASELAHMEL
jgi:hypothetical protein